VHMGEKMRKMARTYNALSAELGREPTDEEVAGGLEWAVEEVREVRGAMPDATSLEQPISSSEESASELGDFIEDEGASDTPETVMREMESAGLYEAIERLPERHRHVLVRRYGLEDDTATLAELSEELGISRERVRQLQREAERMIASGEFGAAVRAAA
jgi:RNA polymerase primary sigma factor